MEGLNSFRVSAFVLDFDGVILESNHVKNQAFRDLFAGFPQHLPAIERYHCGNEGLSRYVKFEWIYRKLLNQPLDQAAVALLDQKFSALVVEGVLASPFVAGAQQFLERFSDRVPIFVASGTPEAEIRDIMRRRGLEKYFAGVFGSPDTKAVIARRIIARHNFRPEECLFVGDALADLEGAAAAGMRFVGRLRPGAGFVFPRSHTFLFVRDLHDLAACLFCDAGRTLEIKVPKEAVSI